MKTLIAALAMATALTGFAAASASAQPYEHRRDGYGPRYEHREGGYNRGWRHGYRRPPHRVCFVRNYHRVCRWVG